MISSSSHFSIVLCYSVISLVKLFVGRTTRNIGDSHIVFIILTYIKLFDTNKNTINSEKKLLQE